MNDLIPAASLLPVQVTDIGLVFESDLTFEQWAELGASVGKVARTSQFMVGDWLNYGQDRWNGGRRFETMAPDLRQRYEQAMHMTGLELDTLQVAASVARRIPITERRAELTFTHHRLISRVKDPVERKEWIQKTESHNLSTRRLRASLNAQRVVPEAELTAPVVTPLRGRETHLIWIQRLIHWWATASASSDYEEMTREQIEAVIDDFGPVLAIVEDLRTKAAAAQSFL